MGVNMESKDWPGGLVVTGRRMALWRTQLLPGRPEPVSGPRGLVGDYVGEKFRVDVSFHEDLSFLGWPLARGVVVAALLAWSLFTLRLWV